jgi:hypothetical protein
MPHGPNIEKSRPRTVPTLTNASFMMLSNTGMAKARSLIINLAARRVALCCDASPSKSSHPTTLLGVQNLVLLTFLESRSANEDFSDLALESK